MNNYNKCYIEYNSKIYRLCEFFETINDKYFNRNEQIKIYLRFKNEIDMSYMFDSCYRLLKVKFLGKISNTINDSNTSYKESELSESFSSDEIDINFDGNKKGFYDLSAIYNLPESNIQINQSEFSGTTILLTDLEITIFNISNIFYECSSLISLPDLSKWNTENVTNMSNLFNGCKSLKSIPDLSKWNTKNVTNMSNLFNGCKSLVSLPDLSNWNTKNVTNMGSMFNGCN